MNHLKKYLTCILLFATVGLSAQAPEGINYQAVARDNGGAVLANENLNVRMTIKENGPAGTTVFQETHNASTNDFGLFDLIIGQGSVVTGTFSAIDWGSASHFLQVEVDDGSGYVNLGTSQFVSVPYALYAKSSGSGGGTTYTAGNGIDISGNVITNTGDTDASDDLTNSSNAAGDVTGNFGNLVVGGIQGRDVSGATPNSGQVLKWNGTEWAPANDVGGGSGDNWGTQVVKTDATLTGSGVSGNELGVAQQGANSGQVLKWNGSAWAPGNDENTSTTYSAGTGLSLSGTTFSNTGDTDASDDVTTSTTAGGDLQGTYPDPSVIALQGNQMNAQNPNDGDVLQWDNGASRWVNVPMGSSPWMTSGNDIYYNNGNVGIGTSSPANAITISQNDIFNYIDIKSSTSGLMETDGTLLGMNSSNNFVIFNREPSKLEFATAGTYRMTISGTGEVGIGTGNPSADLDIESDNPFIYLNSTSGNSGIKFEEAGVATGWLWHNSGNNTINISGSNIASPHLTVTNDGNVGIGTANPGEVLEVDGNIYASGGDLITSATDGVINAGGGLMDPTMNVISDGVVNNDLAGGDEDLYIYDDLEVDDEIRVEGHSTFLDNMGIGLRGTQAGQELHIKQSSSNSDNASIQMESNGGDHWRIGINNSVQDFDFTYNGNVKSYIDPFNGSYNTLSDYRLKESISNPDPVLSKVMQLGVKEYYFKSDPVKDQKTYGFIAQEVKQLFPGFVKTRPEGILTMAYDNFAVLGIQAIQEQQVLIDQLIKENEELKQRVEQLETR